MYNLRYSIRSLGCDGLTIITITFVIILDGLLLDDEPIFEPLEWSLIQTWVIYIYGLTWASEVLFSSRFGSYTNRDKIVWIGLFKNYYGILNWLLINLIILTVFVTLPFYSELTYLFSYAALWWNWFSAPYFFRLFSLFAVLLSCTKLVSLSLRWSSKSVTSMLLLFSLLIVSTIFYFQAVTTILSYSSDIHIFNKTGWSELSRIVNGPLKWGWGSQTRDHFSYHKTTTLIWAKNDFAILRSLLLFNIFLFLFLLILFLQISIYLKISYTSSGLSFNQINTLNNLIQYFLILLSFGFILVMLSIMYQYLRIPYETFIFIKFLDLIYEELDLIVDFFKSCLCFYVIC